MYNKYYDKVAAALSSREGFFLQEQISTSVSVILINMNFISAVTWF